MSQFGNPFAIIFKYRPKPAKAEPKGGGTCLLESDQVNWLILWMKSERRELFSALEGHFQG